jgi:hypothetical protein
MTYDKSVFQEKLSPSYLEVEVANGAILKAKGVGTAKLTFMVDGEPSLSNVKNVHYIPDLDSNLISLGYLDKQGCAFIGGEGRMELSRDGEVLIQGTLIGGMY